MEWIVAESSDDQRSARLEAPPELAPLQAFFWQARDTEYPGIIRAALDGVGIGLDGAGVTFPGDLDDAETGLLQPNEVEVYDAMTEIVLPGEEFLHALLDVGRTALQVRRRRDVADPSWDDEMVAQLAILEERLRR
jgi:hypothetical protein